MALSCLRSLKSLRIRKFLFLTYGGTVIVAFIAILGLCAVSVYTLSANVLNQSRSVLIDQIKLNSQLIAEEAGRVFALTMDTGLRTFVLPVVYGVLDKETKGGSYSLLTSPSFSDSHVQQLMQPTETDARYTCTSVDSEADAYRGCTDGLQQISRGASSVYLEGFNYNGSNVDTLMSSFADQVRLTSVIDDFVQRTWSSDANWVESYVASEGLYRQYPGVVGDLEPYAGPRTYSPQNRPWYRRSANLPQRTSMTMEGVGAFSVLQTEPYKDKFGKGFLIPLSVPIHQGSSLLGVAGTDLQVQALSELIQVVRLRQTGVAHLFEISEGVIVASPQWNPTDSKSLAAKTMMINEIKISDLGTFLSDVPGLAACESTRQEEVNGYMAVYMPVLDGKFCIATIAPMKEIVQPIADQEEIINGVANELFLTSAVICAICFVIIFAFTLLLAIQLSSPLIATSHDTSKMVNNIGSDLFEGVKVENTGRGIGEAARLRTGFVVMMHDLKEKRERTKNTVPPLNPLYHEFPTGKSKSEDPDVCSAFPAEFTKGEPSPEFTAADDAPVPIGKWNKIFHHLMLKLIVPMSLALLVIIILTTVMMADGAFNWIAPVKSSMLTEELTMLDIRAIELSKGVSEIMTTYVNTLQMVADYSERVFSNELKLSSPYASYFSPGFKCNSFSASETPSNCNRKAMMEDTARQRGRSVNLDSSVWYSPEKAVAPGASHSDSAKTQQEGLATHLDNVARVAYFASEAPYIYFGFETTEAYRQYPYQDLEGHASPVKCANPATEESSWQEVSQFTPHCRLWYRNAMESKQKVAFNPVGIDMLGIPFVSLSVSLHSRSSGKVFGVAAVDANLGALQSSLDKTKLYGRGYAYLYDQDGYGIVHKNIKGRSGSFRVEDLEAGDDDKFRNAFKSQVLTQTGKKGTWVYPWLNPDTNQEENWYYSFLPVPGTPYQLVLTVVDSEVEASAREVEGALNVLIAIHCVVSSIIFAIAVLGLGKFSLWFTASFVKPINELNELITNSRECNYAQSVDKSLSASATSAELRSLFENFDKVLIALRFGNQAYYQRSRERELSALRDARNLVESTNNRRGIGVCLNNLALCANAVKSESAATASELLSGDEHNPLDLFQKSVANARELLADGVEGISADTIGQRLLSLSLAKNDAGDVEGALTDMKEAVQLHESSKSWGHLAKLAFIALGRDLPEVFKPTVNMAAQSAAKLLHEHGPVKPEEGSAAARLYFALFRIREDPRFLHAALAKIPNIETPLLQKMAKWAKSGGAPASLLMEIDSRMISTNSWKVGPVDDPESLPTKAIVFLIDRTWAPIIEPAVKSVTDVFQNNVGPKDWVGYFSLGDGWIFPPMPKAGNETEMLEKIRESARTGGRPLLYSSMDQCLKQLERLRGMSLWLVVLSDTVDLEEAFDKNVFQAGMKVMAPPGPGQRYQEATITSVDASRVTVAWKEEPTATGKETNDPNPSNVSAEEGHQPGSIKLEDCQRFAPPPMDAVMDQRLRKAGARTGQVTLSLMWDNVTGGRSDLDLHTQPAHGREICFSNKSSGGGWLDVDMQQDANEPVENCFFENIQDGEYSAKVRNYAGVDKDFKACLRARVPVVLQPSGEILQGLKMVEGRCVGTGEPSDQPIFRFTVKKEYDPAAEQAIAQRPQQVLQSLKRLSGMNLVVIDSRAISGWQPQSPLWPRFQQNVKDFISSSGITAHHLSARNAAEVTQRFQEVAAMMDDAGLAEDL